MLHAIDSANSTTTISAKPVAQSSHQGHAVQQNPIYQKGDGTDDFAKNQISPISFRHLQNHSTLSSHRLTRKIAISFTSKLLRQYQLLLKEKQNHCQQ